MTNTATTTGHDTFCDCQRCVDAQVATIRSLPNNAGPVALDDFDTEDDQPASAPCLRCGRLLHSPKSIAVGYGPTCARKIAAAAKVVDLAAYKTEQVTKATELIASGALVPTGAHTFLTVASDGVTRYETDAYHQTCSCKAGQFGRKCYHLLSALILEAS